MKKIIFSIVLCIAQILHFSVNILCYVYDGAEIFAKPILQGKMWVWKYDEENPNSNLQVIQPISHSITISKKITRTA
jgi:hypothetical protein